MNKYRKSDHHTRQFYADLCRGCTLKTKDPIFNYLLHSHISGILLKFVFHPTPRCFVNYSKREAQGHIKEASAQLSSIDTDIIYKFISSKYNK